MKSFACALAGSLEDTCIISCTTSAPRVDMPGYGLPGNRRGLSAAAEPIDLLIYYTAVELRWETAGRQLETDIMETARKQHDDQSTQATAKESCVPTERWRCQQLGCALVKAGQGATRLRWQYRQ